MLNCPHCQQPIDKRAIACPHCGTTLKAYGHPGIPLHQASEGYLCDTCTYHADDTCNFPQRPYAKECTLYNNLSKQQLEATPAYKIPWTRSIRLWCQRHRGMLLLIAIAAVSILLVVF
ncbi:MAG: zinc ribbon domain-containing protein [Kastovskya adunca ATA6-11-RM4]|nr:zinc ribbon domain-containing protein [Kastovskya adunca ATA6-11-RM4]